MKGPSRIDTVVRAAPSALVQGMWAVVLGLVSSLACVAARLTLRLLQWSFTGHGGLLSEAASSLPPWRRVLVPVLGALCAWTILKARQHWANVSSSTNYVQAVRLEDGFIPFAPTLWRTISSAFSLASGAAVGREGAMIQFAAAGTSWLERRASRAGAPGWDPSMRTFPPARQVACGAAAAVATLYQAPVAGIFFGSEIVLASAAPGDYPRLAFASISGWLVGRLLLGPGPLFPASAAPVAHYAEVAWMLPLAIAAGAIGPLYQWLVRSLHQARGWPLALVWGGLGTGLLSLAQTEVWGNGDAALLILLGSPGGVESAPGPTAVVLALRLCATTLCVGVGTVGGVFTPTLFAGAAAGLLLAHAVHAATPLIFLLAGLSSLLAAVTHAPLMATFMAVELTGRWELLPILLCCNLLASVIAARINPGSLYGIATTNPEARATVHQPQAKDTAQRIPRSGA